MTAYIGYDTIPPNPERVASQSVNDPDTEYPLVNMLDYATHTQCRWLSQAGDNIYSYTCTYAGTEFVDYIGLGVHNLPDGATVNVKNAAGTLHEVLTIVGTGPQLLKLDTPLNDTGLTIEFVNTTGIMAISVLMFGRVLALPEDIGAPATPPPFGRDTTTYPSVSEKGNFLGSHVVRVGWAFQIRQENVDPDWVYANWPALVHHVETYPFFYSWRLESEPGDAVFCWVHKQPGQPRYSNPIYMAWALSCRGMHVD